MKVLKISIITGIVVLTLASFTDISGPDSFTTPALSVSDTLVIDAETGLIADKNLPIVKANCTGCHSTKLISQHRFTREGWVGKIRWMQQYQNLWDLGESEKTVLDYLEKYYSPESAANKAPARRQSLKDIQWYKL